MDVTQTLHNLLVELDFHDSSEYISADSRKVRPQDQHFLDWGRDKIEAEGVVLQRIPANDSSYPLAYFRQLDEYDTRNIADAHRLAWNMGRAPLLFIVVPGRILVHSTYERPRPRRTDRSLGHEAGLIDVIDLVANVEQARQQLQKYRREELLSGRLWERENIRKRFNPSTRVETNLLKNLSAIRSLLVDREGLDARVVHSLLGRAIFIQYLQDRTDAQGYSAFPEGYFGRFWPGAACFPDVLSSKQAAYSLFEALEDKFNGDIFPVTPTERRDVRKEHLELLAHFLTGKIEIRNRQLSFWPYYSFDAIPIEFISNMYEAFFHYEEQERDATQDRRTERSRAGTYYTPHRLVEFVMDEVLPWEGTSTEVRILDPACGSGIFLVESYRRLISRWRQANPQASPDSRVLKKLLVDNLYGVDQNAEAVRVAAFSLYLTMCDNLEPRYVWANVKFPSLREKNLWDQDFFEFADAPPNRADSFDLVVGNPPWESQLSQHAEAYIERRALPIGDKQIAQAFLWAAPEMCNERGRVCLIAPSKGLLFNASGPNRKFRRKFLETFKVNTIVNFASLRKNLFAKAVGPAAPVIYEPMPPAEEDGIVYCCPKPSNSPEDGWHYVIEKHDTCRIPWRKAVQHEQIWKTAMWGGPRDWELIEKLAELPSLRQVTDRGGWADGEGFIVGRKNRKRADWLTGKPFVSPELLKAFTIDEDVLPPLTETQFTEPRSKNRRIFQGPHLLASQSPRAGKGFIAAFLQGDVVFNHSLLGISASSHDADKLGAVCVAFATNICTYFAMMTSSRWLVERDELDKGEMMKFPLPSRLQDGSLHIPFSQLRAATNDRAARKKLVRSVSDAYALSATDRALISDAVEYTLDYFRLGAKSNAAKPAAAKMLRKYGALFCRILRASFGESKSCHLPATFYVGDSPMIVLKVSLSPVNGQQRVEIRQAGDQLSDALRTMDGVLMEKHSAGVYVRRDVHVYIDNEVYIAKRSQLRLWTQSAAMREADEIYAEIMRAWGQHTWK